MVDPENHSAMIKAEALRLGFDLCGIARAEPLRTEAERLSRWLQRKYHGSMRYMENHFDKRTDVTRLVPGAQSVIVVMLNYYSDKSQSDSRAPVISKYAYGKDYHDIIRKKLKLLLQYINKEIGHTSGRPFADSAPVMDKAWAVRAGLGWMGKNSNIIAPGQGSFMFIGILPVDRVLPYDEPVSDRCGDCVRCIRACPTGAIIEPYIVNGSRCISFLTIENREEIPQEFKGKMENRSFGCDICQDVCPWNRRASHNKTSGLLPLPGMLERTREEWYKLTENEFHTAFPSSPLKRAGYKGLKRNLDFLLS
jgi:epoxyqueuosine reductase